MPERESAEAAVLLAIDDDPVVRHLVGEFFPPPGYRVTAAATAAEGLAAARLHRPDVTLLDVRLPDSTGFEVFQRLRADGDAGGLVVFIAAGDQTEPVIQAMKLGAFDFIMKPLEAAPVRRLVDRAVGLSRATRRAAASPAAAGTPPDGPPTLVGRSAAMREVYKAVGRVAGLDAPVLVLGESGTGKELVARAVHRHSGRADRVLVSLNCAAFPETLIESELFGHERGAFTGADQRRVGKFEQAQGGTLFLDEVGELSPAAQAKLLRVIQEKEFERVGGTAVVRADVRLIAATNRDLDAMAAAGTFRLDLLYRLNTFVVRLPPLRERLDDLPLLVEACLAEIGRTGGRPPVVSPEALAALAAHSWPGNVRELLAVLRRAAIAAPGGVLLPHLLPLPPAEARPERPPESTDWGRFVESRLLAGSDNLYRECLESVEKDLLERVLRHTNGNQLRAADILGINRKTLRTRLRSLGLRENTEGG